MLYQATLRFCSSNVVLIICFNLRQRTPVVNFYNVVISLRVNIFHKFTILQYFCRYFKVAFYNKVFYYMHVCAKPGNVINMSVKWRSFYVIMLIVMKSAVD